MFIRIKRRRLKSSDDENPDFSLRVYLVENRRIKGNPRQRVIAYLGSIRRSDTSNDKRRKNFLHSASNRIDSMSSNYREVLRLKQSMIKLIVAERYTNRYPVQLSEKWLQEPALEPLLRKVHESMVESATAVDATRKALWNIRPAREELSKRRS